MKITMALSFIIACCAMTPNISNAQAQEAIEGKLLTPIGTKINRTGDAFTLAVRQASGRNTILRGRVISVTTATPQRKAEIKLRIYDLQNAGAQTNVFRLEVLSLVSPDGAVRVPSPSVLLSTKKGDFVLKKGTILRLKALVYAVLPSPSAVKHGAASRITPAPRWGATRDVNETFQ